MQRAKCQRQIRNKVNKRVRKKLIIVQSGSYLISHIRESANCKLMGLSRIGLLDEERAP